MCSFAKKLLKRYDYESTKKGYMEDIGHTKIGGHYPAKGVYLQCCPRLFSKISAKNWVKLSVDHCVDGE